MEKSCSLSQSDCNDCCYCVTFISVVLKLFHVEDPQIDTYKPADPRLKRYARDPHIKEDVYSSGSDFKPFSIQGPPQFDMH